MRRLESVAVDIRNRDEKVVDTSGVMVVGAVVAVVFSGVSAVLIIAIVMGMMVVMFRVGVGTAGDDRKRTPEQTHLDQQGEKNQRGCAHVVGDG